VQQSFLIGVASVAGNLVDIGTPGGPTAEPRAMNAIGQVLAWATVSVNLPSHAWLWSPNAPNATSGAWNDLGTLDGSDDSQPYAINDSGEVVGSSSGPQGPQAFIWRPYEPNVPTGTMTALNSGGAESVALGINNAHQVVGAFLTATGAQAALWTADGEMIPLDSPADAVATIALAISPDGKVAGYFQKADSSSRAFLWTPSSPNATTGSLQDLGTLGGSNAAAYAVNAAGQVVGVSETSDGFAHAVLWTPNGGMTDLNALGANSTRATGISDSGMITGQLTSADGSQHPFVWTPSAPNGTNGTMVDVQGLGGSQALAAGINNSGQIAGWSYLTGDPTTNDGISHIEHAFVTRPLAVSHLTQTTTFAALGDKIFGDVDFTVNATASSGLTVTFSASGSCAVTGDSVQITGAGSCTITASQPGNSTYAAATDVPRAFSIAKATQAAVTINAPASLTSGSAATLMSGGGNGSGAVTFSVGLSTGCSVSGDQLSVTIVTGTCSVSATKAADSNYNAASSGSASVTLLKGTAVLTLSNLTQAFDGTPKSVTVTTTPAGVTGVAVTYNGLSAPPTNAGSYAVIASLTNNNYQATNATGTLAIIASSLKNLTLSATSVPGGVTVTGTVTLMGKAPAGGVPVALSSSNTAAATVPAMVTVPANAMSAQFSVTTLAVAASASTVISGAWGGTKTASLSVTPAALSSVTVTPATITGGAPATGTVTLTGAAPTNGAVIPLSSSLSAAAVPASVTVPAGQTSATFPISTSAVSATAKPTISATYVSVTKTAALTVNAPGVSSVTLSPTSVKGGTSSTGTVTLTGIAPAGGLVVSLSSNKAATVPASVPVPTGSRSAVFTITTSTVKATTSAAITATGGGTKASATLTVTP